MSKAGGGGRERTGLYTETTSRQYTYRPKDSGDGVSERTTGPAIRLFDVSTTAAPCLR